MNTDSLSTFSRYGAIAVKLTAATYASIRSATAALRSWVVPRFKLITRIVMGVGAVTLLLWAYKHSGWGPYKYHVSQIPANVQTLAFDGEILADPGEPFAIGCVRSHDEATARLIWAYHADHSWIVHFEQGGSGYSCPAVEIKDGKPEARWVTWKPTKNVRELKAKSIQ